MFDLDSGRYFDDDTGEFVEGPPKDYDPETNRFRAQDGAFKDRSHYHDEALGSRQDGGPNQGRSRNGGGAFGSGLGALGNGKTAEFGAGMQDAPRDDAGIRDRNPFQF